MSVTIYDLTDELSNENEKLVIDIVNQLQVEKKLPCDCRECLLDITAIALNKLQPRYSVSLLKSIYRTEADLEKHDLKVRKVVEEACEKVKVRPHHFDE